MFYADRGQISAWDGEYFARKGALKVKIIWENHKVDLVVTHLVAESQDLWSSADLNKSTRQNQIMELLQFVNNSCDDSDFVVLGGDFNFGVTDDSYKFVLENDFFDTGAETKDRVTWGHPENTWGNSPAYLIDYVFVKSNRDDLNVHGSSIIPEKAFQ